MLTTAAAQNTASEIISTGLRPYLSLSGPRNICPNPRPAMPVVSPNCTIGTEHLKNSVISGRDGRYISLTKEPKALSAARYITRYM